ncbi:MAG: hypothetical protein LBH05_00810 [Deferribacteraceae bacterium]|jgi:hypothetical protein|nr:hypothetical protein [Deferribacteraceae bacterium]
MSIFTRCSKCHIFNALKHNTCPKCATTDKVKAYYVSHSVAGKRTFEYAGNKLSIAKSVDADRKLEKRTGKLPQYAKLKIMNFAEFINTLFIPHFEAKNKSIQKPQYIIKFFKDFFADIDICAIKPIDIERAVLAGTGGKSSASYNYFIAIIKRMFNYAIEIDKDNRPRKAIATL